MAIWHRAMVTGASSGIGEQVARRLAADGTDLVLVARRDDRLHALAAELGGVDVEVRTADLAERSQLDAVAARCADRDRPLDLLVNNAGLGSTGDFVDAALETQQQQLDVNVVALVRLTHAVLAGMRDRRAGAVMNVSSIVSFQPLPFNATYAATKAFVTSFSESLHEELRGSGVTVTAVCPGMTRTEFQHLAGADQASASMPEVFWMEADEVAAIAIADTAKGRPLCVPGAQYRLAASLTNVTPRWLRRRAVAALSKRP